MINPNIFKVYDVRGIYPDEIDEKAAYKTGQAFVRFLENEGAINNRQIVVGRDARPSSEGLFAALEQGLLSQGVDIVDIGLVSTPLFYWAIISEGAAGGIMITASHNPAKYNGFKICAAGARSIGANNGLLKIRDLAEKNQPGISVSPGRVSQKNLLNQYLDFTFRQIDFKKIKPLKIVVDCGNGMAGPELAELFKKIPCQADLLYPEPDGRFPHHEADPIKKENISDLRQHLLSSAANLGVALDGDADRIVFLDEKGEMVRPDFITILIAQDLLKNNAGQKIFYEVRSGKIVPEIILKTGGVPVEGRAGHSLIKEQMRQENILFGGETSGHYFYKSLGFIENALFTLSKVLEILSQTDKPMSELVAPLKKYYHSGEVNFETTKADKILAEVEKKYSSGQIKKIDGLTVEYPNWRFNLRKSNTEPLVRLNLEANSADLLDEKRKEITDLINE
jgi:phosphomannomutase